LASSIVTRSTKSGKAPLAAGPAKPFKLSLQAVVLIILGAMLVYMQVAAEISESVKQLRQVEENASRRGAVALDLIASLVRNDTEVGADPAALLATLDRTMLQYAGKQTGMNIWAIASPTVTDLGALQSIKAAPQDVADRAALQGNAVIVVEDNHLRMSRPTVTTGPLAVYSVSIDLSGDYAEWSRRLKERVTLEAIIVLSTLALAVLLMRRVVVSPLERLSEMTRHLAAGETVTVEPVSVWTEEIGELSDALIIFRDNIEQRRRLEQQNVEALVKLERATGNLDLALRSMTQGLCLFDRNQRVVLLNERFLEIFGLDEIELRQRLSAEALAALVIRSLGVADCRLGTRPAGMFTGPVEETGDQPGFGSEPVTLEVRFQDRSLSLTHAATDEGGWVTTVEDITLRRQHEERIAYLARFDTLTGLPNRVQFSDRLKIELEWARANDVRVAAVEIDFDKFKEINDQQGHAVGDVVLAEIGRRLGIAIAEGEFVARIGGDEFAAIKRFQDDADLREFLDRLDGCYTAPVHIESEAQELAVNASIGVAVFPADAADAETLINNAELALFRAKRSVSQSICFYEAAMDELARERRTMAHDLWEALGKGQFHLTYQVQKRVTTLETTGYEALIRWSHPERGAISPEQFIPVAEECGAIVPIGQWVLRQACTEAAAWETDHRVAVNLSPVQLANDDIVSLVRRVLIETGLSPRRLELEITESTIISDKAHALHVLRQLKALGVTVALDDFGTGYSSLDTLNSFPFDKIKIDRSFLMAAEVKPESRAIVKAVLALGRSLSVPVLAEGVETPGQLAILEEEGCHEAQGFLFGRPAKLIPSDVEVQAVDAHPAPQIRAAG
jgi:diguanylate cyclase (GGDEF)-like protein